MYRMWCETLHQYEQVWGRYRWQNLKCSMPYLHCRFRATFDFRKHCRVHVHLPGRLLQLRTREEVEPIVVTSLSVTGLGFVTAPGVSVCVGDKYEVVFVFDDEDQSVLFEEIVITRVHGTEVGAVFSPSHYANHDLIFFMMSEMSAIMKRGTETCRQSGSA